MVNIARKSDGRRIFTDEFKREQIGRVWRGELNLAELSRELGIARSLLQRWKRLAHHGDAIVGATNARVTRASELRAAHYIRSFNCWWESRRWSWSSFARSWMRSRRGGAPRDLVGGNWPDRWASSSTRPGSTREVGSEHEDMKVLGFALVILGILALVYGGISYSRQRTVLEVGSFKATATEQKNIPLSPIVGGIVLVIGVVLLVVPRKRRA